MAAEVARALDGELDVVVARKLRSPISAELAIGGVTAEPLLHRLGVSARYVERVTQVGRAEAMQREERQTEDDEVEQLLSVSRSKEPAPASASGG